MSSVRVGSELIHYEALRKQLINDRRNAYNIEKTMHKPPYQPYYSVHELPKDDMYLPREPVLEAYPTVTQFTYKKSNEPWKFMSYKDVHGSSSKSYRDPTLYSAKIPNRYNVSIRFFSSHFNSLSLLDPSSFVRSFLIEDFS